MTSDSAEFEISKRWRRGRARWFLRRVAKFSIDATVATAAMVGAVLLHFEGQIPEAIADSLVLLIGVSVVAKFFANYVAGGHKRLWHYTSAREAAVLAVAAGASTLFLLGISLTGLVTVPRSVLVVDGILFLLGISGVRIVRRLQFSASRRGPHRPGRDRVRALMVGAGDTANALIADLQHRNEARWNIVGILDDDPAKQGATLRGYPILGPTTQLANIIQHENAGHVILAMPSARKAVLRRLISRVQSAGATVQGIPSLDALLRDGRRNSGSIAVTLEDLMDSSEVKKTLLPRTRRHPDKETVLVTGGAGYIGSHVVRQLLDLGYRVRVLDNFTYGDEGLIPIRDNPDLELVTGDISSIRDVASSVKDVNRVIALAAIVGDPACGLNAEETLNLNYESTKVLIESCNFYGVQRLVFASSCSVYGASESGLLTETSALNPVSLYARTRILSEEVLLERAGDVEPVVLRLSTIFGLSPRMRFDLVVNLLTAKAVVEKHIRIFGGEQWRPFVHCRDAAHAFVLAATAPGELVRGEMFNVGSTELNYTIASVGEMVAQVVGDDVDIEYVDLVDDPRNYRVAFDKIVQTLGFKPEMDLTGGITEMAEAIRQNPNLQAYDQSSYSNLKWLRDRMEGEMAVAEASAGP